MTHEKVLVDRELLQKIFESLDSRCGTNTHERTEIIPALLELIDAPAPKPAPVQEAVSIPEMLRETSPKRIWLGLFTDDEDANFPENHEGMRWADSEYADLNVPYIRADLAQQPAPPADVPMLTDDELMQMFTSQKTAQREMKFARAIEKLYRQKAGLP